MAVGHGELGEPPAVGYLACQRELQRVHRQQLGSRSPLCEWHPLAFHKASAVGALHGVVHRRRDSHCAMEWDRGTRAARGTAQATRMNYPCYIQQKVVGRRWGRIPLRPTTVLPEVREFLRVMCRTEQVRSSWYRLLLLYEVVGIGSVSLRVQDFSRSRWPTLATLPANRLAGGGDKCPLAVARSAPTRLLCVSDLDVPWTNNTSPGVHYFNCACLH